MSEQTEMSFVEAVSEWNKGSRFIRAFEKIGEVLKLAAKAEETISHAAGRLDKINKEIEAAKEAKEAAEAAAKKTLADTREAVNREIKVLDEKRSQARKEFDEGIAEFDGLRHRAQADFDEFVADFERQKSDMEGERGRLEAEIKGLAADLEALKRRVLGQ